MVRLTEAGRRVLELERRVAALETREAGLAASANLWMERAKALEERLDRWGDHSWSCAFIQHALTCDCGYLEARALLAAAPDHQHTWEWVQTGPESGGRVCSECGHPETLSEAAAPSEPPTRCEHLDERGRRCIVVGQHQRAAGVIHTYQADPLILEGDPAALPAEDDSVAAQALIDSWGGTEDQWGNFYPHEPVSEASDE